MALLNILCYPDSRLHKVAAPVTAFDDKLRKLVADMLETMYEAQGVGLAATQVDVHQRLVVLDTSEERNQATVLINPEITWYSEERVKGEEGACLSLAFTMGLSALWLSRSKRPMNMAKFASLKLKA